MKTMRKLLAIYIIIIFMSGIALADDLPPTAPENQLFTTKSLIDGVGVTHETTTFAWSVGDQEKDEIPIPRGSPYGIGSVSSGSVAYSTYKDVISTNGGLISEVKSFNLDNTAKTEGLYNINTEKILTYNSQTGSHLFGDEAYILNVMGNWTWTPGASTLTCVFSSPNHPERLIPSFCNKVTASARLLSITTAQVETMGELSTVASSIRVPAALNYEISVTPDANSVSGYADGIVATTFTINVMEGRIDGNFSPGLVPNMINGVSPWRAHNGSGSMLNAGSFGSFAYGEDGDENSIFIGNSSGYNFQFPADPTPPQQEWATDIIAVIKDGVMIFFAEWPYPNGMPTGPGNELVLDGVQIMKYGGGYDYTTNTAEEVWYRIEFTEQFGRIPPGSVYDVKGISTVNSGYYATNITTTPPYLEFYDDLGATISTIDTTRVTGGITNFAKVFNYKSGAYCTDC